MLRGARFRNRPVRRRSPLHPAVLVGIIALAFSGLSATHASSTVPSRVVPPREPKHADLSPERLREDAAEADARNTQGTANGIAVSEFFRQRAPGVFGGVFIDHLEGGSSIVAVTADPELYERALRQVVPYPERIRMRVVEHSLQELESLHAQILSDLPKLRDMGVSVTGVVTNEQENTVDVGVERASPDVEVAIRSRYSAPYLRVRNESPAVLQGYGGLDSPPLKGGLGIWTYKPRAPENAHLWRNAEPTNGLRRILQSARSAAVMKGEAVGNVGSV